MDAIVITGCTNRKRAKPNSALLARNLSTLPLPELADQWVSLLESEVDRTLVSKLYCGRAFREAVAAGKILKAEIYVVSAGLGVVSAESEVPSYGLTLASRESDSIQRHFATKGSNADWWKQLTARSPFHQPLDVIAGDKLVLIALSQPYLEMVLGDLLTLPERVIDRLRIFARVTADELPDDLRDNLMPYDLRLDGPESPLRGTLGDFAQRSLRHFSQWVFSRDPFGGAAGHAALVRAALAPYGVTRIPTRKKAENDEIAAAIQQHWSESNGGVSKMLRYFRDELGIACEQTRFKKIFWEVAAARDERARSRAKG